jgi:hypothetical protein
MDPAGNVSNRSPSRKIARQQLFRIKTLVVHQPSAPTRGNACDLPQDAVAIGKFLLFALQKAYES